MSAIRVLTFNVRFGDAADGAHAWPARRELAVRVIRGHDADLIGLQEPTAGQWDDITRELSGYSRFETTMDGEVEPTGGFYRTLRFARVDGGVFWLSDTPGVAQSVTWSNDWGPNSCAWLRVRDRVHDCDLVFACTHWDTNAGAWLPSARVLHTELDRIAGPLPVIVVGDFNCAAGSEAHRYLLDDAAFRDAWYEAGHADEGTVTYHGFTGATRLPAAAPARNEWLHAVNAGIDQFRHYPAHVARHGNYRIDWILFRGPFECVSAEVDLSANAGLPSDHFPVAATLKWRDNEGL